MTPATAGQKIGSAHAEALPRGRRRRGEEVDSGAFVDESEQREYLLVAAVISPTALDATRKAPRALVMPGQRRIHMKKGGPALRSTIIETITIAGIRPTICNAGHTGRHELTASAACIRAVVVDAAAENHRMLVLEQDDSLIQHDRRNLYAAVHAAGCQDSLRYEHRRAEHEFLLAVPDAIAWCWAKGGHWRDRVRPIVTNRRSV